MTVCFLCTRERELVPDHHCCDACHDDDRCRRVTCVERRHGYRPPPVPKRDLLVAALVGYGGSATTRQLAAVTGLKPMIVSAVARNANGVEWVADRADRVNRGRWHLSAG